VPRKLKEPNNVKIFRLIKTLLPVMTLTIGTLSFGTSPAEQFRGQATAVSVSILGITTTLGDTGALPAKGGALQNNLLTLNVPLVLSGGVAESEVIGVGDHTDASSTVAGLNVLTSGIGITADLLQSRAYVIGSVNTPPVSWGTSQIANLNVNGLPIIVTGAPNQTITLPLGKIVLNEIKQGAGNITVTAIHLTITGIADVALARSYAQVGPCTGCSGTCTGTPNCSGNNDFLTGAGSLLNSLNGTAYFGLALGLNNGLNWGNIIFNDASSLTSFQGTSVSAYTVVSATERIVQGVGKLNGLTTVNYTLDIVQKTSQESIFTLTLSNGYTISGQINLGFLQIRQSCNS
jgi:hypothetical protein